MYHRIVCPTQLLLCMRQGLQAPQQAVCSLNLGNRERPEVMPSQQAAVWHLAGVSRSGCAVDSQQRNSSGSSFSGLAVESLGEPWCLQCKDTHDIIYRRAH